MHVGGGSELAVRMALELFKNEGSKFQAQPIAKTRPDKVEALVSADEPEAIEIVLQLCFQHDCTFTNEAGGVNWRALVPFAGEELAAVIPKRGAKANGNGTTELNRQPRYKTLQ